MSDQHPAPETATPETATAGYGDPQRSAEVVPAAPAPYVSAHAGAVPQMQVAPKNPGIALLVSFFFPGLGTLMNGETGKGIGIFAGYVVSWFLCFVLIGIPFLIGFWIWGMVDAYNGAKKWNAQHGIIS